MRPPSPEKGVVASREAKPCEMERGAATLETVTTQARNAFFSPVMDFTQKVLKLQEEELENAGAEGEGAEAEGGGTGELWRNHILHLIFTNK